MWISNVRKTKRTSLEHQSHSDKTQVHWTDVFLWIRRPERFYTKRILDAPRLESLPRWLVLWWTCFRRMIVEFSQALWCGNTTYYSNQMPCLWRPEILTSCLHHKSKLNLCRITCVFVFFLENNISARIWHVRNSLRCACTTKTLWTISCAWIDKRIASVWFISFTTLWYQCFLFFLIGNKT